MFVNWTKVCNPCRGFEYGINGFVGVMVVIYSGGEYVFGGFVFSLMVEMKICLCQV